MERGKKKRKRRGLEFLQGTLTPCSHLFICLLSFKGAWEREMVAYFYSASWRCCALYSSPDRFSAGAFPSLPLLYFSCSLPHTHPHQQILLFFAFPSAHDATRPSRVDYCFASILSIANEAKKLTILIKTYLFVITPTSYALYGIFVGDARVSIAFFAYSFCLYSSPHSFVLGAYRVRIERKWEYMQKFRKATKNKGGERGEEGEEENIPFAPKLHSDLSPLFRSLCNIPTKKACPRPCIKDQQGLCAWHFSARKCSDGRRNGCRTSIKAEN